MKGVQTQEPQGRKLGLRVGFKGEMLPPMALGTECAGTGAPTCGWGKLLSFLHSALPLTYQTPLHRPPAHQPPRSEPLRPWVSETGGKWLVLEDTAEPAQNSVSEGNGTRFGSILNCHETLDRLGLL